MAPTDRLPANKTPSGPTAPAAPGSPTGSTGADPAKNGGRPAARVPGSGTPPPTHPQASLYTPLRTADSKLSAVDQLKVDLHRRLIDRLDLDALEQISSEKELTSQIRKAVLEVSREEAPPLSQREREEIVEQIIYEVTGLGPIEPLFRDPTISDILVNGARQI